MKCPKCQFDNPSDSGFCSKCGTQLLPTEEISVSHNAETLETAIEELWGKNRDVVTNQMKEGIGRCKMKGAGSVILGCMSLAFLMVDNIFEEKTGIPIVNPLKTAIKTAEMFVDLEAKHSRISYPPADFEKLKNTVFTK